MSDSNPDWCQGGASSRTHTWVMVFAQVCYYAPTSKSTTSTSPAHQSIVEKCIHCGTFRERRQ